MPTPYCYDYPRPMVTVDLVVFALTEDGLRSLFIRRKKDPFAGHWAIPGGYLEMDEPIEAAARRELEEETGLAGLARVDEIGVFGDPGRDPRGRTISVAHAAVIRGPLPDVEGGDDANDAAWLDPTKVDRLAFDHEKIVARALGWLKRGVIDGPLGPCLLPESFGADEAGHLLTAVGEGRRGRLAWLRRTEKAGRIARESDQDRYRVVPPGG